MINVSSVIKRKLKERRISQADFAKDICMSDSGLRTVLRNNTWTLDRLERTAKILNVPLLDLIAEGMREGKQ